MPGGIGPMDAERSEAQYSDNAAVNAESSYYTGEVLAPIAAKRCRAEAVGRGA